MTETASMPPFSLVGIDHVVLLVNDLDRAMRFYREAPAIHTRGSGWSRFGAAMR